MITVYAPQHAQHDPPHEFLEGEFIGYNETPARAEIILQALQAAQLGPIRPPDDFGIQPIQAVHSGEYLDFLANIYQRWCAAGGTPEAALASVMPVRRFQRRSPHPFAEIGYFSFDCSAPVVAGTYAAALASAHCALTAAELVLKGESYAYALCRPPGHHADVDLMGGFCFLNNAAIVAQYLLDQTNDQQHTAPQEPSSIITHSAARVAILDIDVHHGNGTQGIFYDRSDVLFVSLHGSPEYEYPYFSGWADERGTGAGEGFTINYPLAVGTGDAEYLNTLDDALDQIRHFRPSYLVLSAGMDAFAGDPLGKLQLTTACFHAIGTLVADLKIPTVIVQEGGYTVSALGDNVVSLLRGVVGA